MRQSTLALVLGVSLLTLAGTASMSPAFAEKTVVLSSFFGAADFPTDEGWRMTRLPGLLRFTCADNANNGCDFDWFLPNDTQISETCPKHANVLVLGSLLVIPPECVALR